MTVKRRRILGAAFFGAGVALAAWLFDAGVLLLNRPDPRRFPVRGIDVSHHQGHVSWFAAGMDQVDFAYLKATEGTDFTDRDFAYNWEQARKNEIPVGAYHFFNPCASGTLQARHFLATVPNAEGTLPPALDLESSGNCHRRISRADLRREVTRFTKELAKGYKGVPVFYVTPEYYARYFEGHRQEFPPHRLWIRNVLRQPSQQPRSEWTFWQYASRARVKGIQGPVDRNVFCGGPDAFQALMRR